MFENLDDPRKQALLAMAAGLFSPVRGKGWSGFGEAIGQGINAGLLGLNQATRTQEAVKRGEMERKLEQARLAEYERGQKFNQVAFRPGVGAMPATPNDDNGYPMPSQEQTFDYAAAAAVDPMKAWQMKQQMEQKPKPLVVGDTLVDPTTYQPLYQAPKEPKLPPGMRMGANGPEWIPEYLAGKKQVAAAGAPNLNVGAPTQEREEHKQRAIANASFAKSASEARAGAIRENQIIDSLLRNPLDTGAATPLTATAKAWLSAAGMANDRIEREVGDFQAFRAAAKEMVLQKQLLQKGPQTESDARRLEQTTADPANEKRANQIILKFNKALNNRAIAQAKFIDAWWREKKTYEGAEDAWLSGEGGKSIWDDPLLKDYRGASRRVYNPATQQIEEQD